MASKGTNKILDELEAQGFEVTRTRKNHLRVTKDGKHVTVFASTPSDSRSDLNSLADRKRAGFIWPVPAKKGK